MGNEGKQTLLLIFLKNHLYLYNSQLTLNTRPLEYFSIERGEKWSKKFLGNFLIKGDMDGLLKKEWRVVETSMLCKEILKGWKSHFNNKEGYRIEEK